MASRWGVAFLIGATLVILAGPGLAIEGLREAEGPPDIAVRARAAEATVAPGSLLGLRVTYEVPARHHVQVNEFLYAEVEEGQPARIVGEPSLPPTTLWDGEPILAGRFEVGFQLEIAPDALLGERELKLLVGYQSCAETPIFVCYPPDEKEVTVVFRVVAPGEETQEAAVAQPEAVVPEEPGAVEAGSAAVEGGVQEGLADRLRGALARGSWMAFLLVFIAGFLTSFTPCVYPMIPITIGFVAGRSEGRLSGFILSLFFVLGIAIVYSTLGVAAALTGGVFGAALQSTAALIFIAAVFVVMGVSMLGAFDLSLPAGLQTKLQGGRRGGLAGAVVMGGVTGLVASPCVGPVLVVLLTWVAQVGRPVYGLSLLFTFALGLGVLFLVLGTFVGAVKSLPKAGRWMEDVKHYFGWIFLFLAVFFLKTKIGPTVTTIAYGTLLVLFATQVGAFSSPAPEAGGRGRWAKGIGVVLLVFGIAMMANGLAMHFGWRSAIGPEGLAPERATRGLAWHTDEEAAFARARQEGKPILIDFSAEWCGACHELDEKTFSESRVMAELGRFVLLRHDLTHRTPETRTIRERWKVTGLPTVIVLDAGGEEKERFFGFRNADQVLPLLRRIS